MHNTVLQQPGKDWVYVVLPRGGTRCAVWFPPRQPVGLVFAADETGRLAASPMHVLAPSMLERVPWIGTGAVLLGVSLAAAPAASQPSPTSFCILDVAIWDGAQPCAASGTFRQGLEWLRAALEWAGATGPVRIGTWTFGLAAMSTAPPEAAWAATFADAVVLRHADTTGAALGCFLLGMPAPAAEIPVPVPKPKPAAQVPAPAPPKKRRVVFELRADLQWDVYWVWAYQRRTRQMERIGAAYVSDCETSAMLNRLFRRVREMDNLDYIEESEDEADFEDARDDKYMRLDHVERMECEYVPFCGRWQPVCTARSGAMIGTIEEANSVIATMSAATAGVHRSAPAMMTPKPGRGAGLSGRRAVRAGRHRAF